VKVELELRLTKCNEDRKTTEITREKHMNTTYKARTLTYPGELHHEIMDSLEKLIHDSLFVDDNGRSFFAMFDQKDKFGNIITVLKDRDYITGPECEAVVRRLDREVESLDRDANLLREIAKKKRKILDAETLEETPPEIYYCYGVPLDPYIVKNLKGGTFDEMTNQALADPAFLDALGLTGESRATVKRKIYGIVKNAKDSNGTLWFWQDAPPHGLDMKEE